MKVYFLLFVALFVTTLSTAQTTITFDEEDVNKMYIKLYGHVDYNQKIEEGVRHTGKMDVHRLVTLFGYQFNRNTQFVSEIEVEHVKEIFIEQAWVKHKISNGINLKAGLLLVPMGFVNEMHEPTFFYSVERPLLDKNIIPTTWREIGAGITGLFPRKSLKYQLYLINNPVSYSGSAKFNGAQGIRGGRQKGAESIVTTFPGLSGQIEYYGWLGAKLGLSAYYGNTNTSLFTEYGGVINEEIENTIDSSRVKMTMATLHASYDFGQWTTRFQYTLAGFAGAEKYNDFTGSDLPELMHGYYALLAYDFIKSNNQTLSPFIRFSQLDNHLKVPDNITENPSLKQNIYTIGINYKPDPGIVFKMDYEFYNIVEGNNYQQFNTGIGVWF